MGGRDDKASSKIFVGRVTENITKEDLMEHFNNFGQVTDVYIPNPFRHFAFVQVHLDLISCFFTVIGAVIINNKNLI
jgi:hypothetical protein